MTFSLPTSSMKPCSYVTQPPGHSGQGPTVGVDASTTTSTVAASPQCECKDEEVKSTACKSHWQPSASVESPEGATRNGWGSAVPRAITPTETEASSAMSGRRMSGSKAAGVPNMSSSRWVSRKSREHGGDDDVPLGELDTSLPWTVHFGGEYLWDVKDIGHELLRPASFYKYLGSIEESGILDFRGERSRIGLFWPKPKHHFSRFLVREVGGSVKRCAEVFVPMSCAWKSESNGFHSAFLPVEESRFERVRTRIPAHPGLPSHGQSYSLAFLQAVSHLRPHVPVADQVIGGEYRELNEYGVVLKHMLDRPVPAEAMFHHLTMTADILKQLAVIMKTLPHKLRAAQVRPIVESKDSVGPAGAYPKFYSHSSAASGYDRGAVYPLSRAGGVGSMPPSSFHGGAASGSAGFLHGPRREAVWRGSGHASISSPSPAHGFYPLPGPAATGCSQDPDFSLKHSVFRPSSFQVSTVASPLAHHSGTMPGSAQTTWRWDPPLDPQVDHRVGVSHQQWHPVSCYSGRPNLMEEEEDNMSSVSLPEEEEKYEEDSVVPLAE